MTIIKRLESRIKEFDGLVWEGSYYRQWAADDRALLEAALDHIRNAKQSNWDAYHVGVADGRRNSGIMKRPGVI